MLTLKKPAPNTQATAPLASRDVNGPCFVYILQYLYVSREILVNMFEIKFSQRKLVMKN